MEFERSRESHIERPGSHGPSGREGGGERRPPTTRQRDMVVTRSLLSSYTDIAQRLTDGGYGVFSVVEAEKQVLADGRPMDNPALVVATFSGQEDWDDFQYATIEINRLLAPFSGSKTEEEVGLEAVEEAKRKGLEVVASRARIRRYVIESASNRPKEK